MMQILFFAIIVLSYWCQLCASTTAPICGFVAATNVESLFSYWSCNSTGGPATDPCGSPPWEGLTCSSEGQITSILFQNSDNQTILVGTLAPSLGELTALGELNLEKNTLVGSVPSALGQLSLLSVLDLSRNRLEGLLPPGLLDTMPLLVHLNLLGNKLSGALPSGLMGCTALRRLDVSMNAFTGSFPALSTEVLEYLYLQENMFSQTLPTSICSLSRLIDMFIYYNSFTGTVPGVFGSLARLERVIASHNMLVGPVPSEYGPDMTLVDWSINSFSGTLPSALGQLSLLVQLRLEFNSISGTVPTSFAGLTALTSLQICCNSLTGRIPTFLGPLSKLLFLDLYTNHFTGRLPAAVGSLTSLTSLDVDSNLLTGELPSALWGLTRLAYIGVASNSFTGTIPTGVAQLTALSFLHLYKNCLSGTLPLALTALTELDTMSLEHNYITGTIPPELELVGKLKTLYLYQNNFTGTVPASLGNLTGLRNLYLNSNCLEGTLPESLSGLDLDEIFVYNNRFTGTLPSFGSSRHIVDIQMYENSFQGSIPQEWASFELLGSLQMRDNLLTGTVPADLLRLSILVALDLSENFFTGTLPQIVAPKLKYFDVSGGLLTGRLDVGSLDALHLFRAASNMFSGTVPGNFGDSLATLDVGLNSLSGSVPPILGAISSLNFADVAYNSAVDGTVPGSLCATTSMMINVSGTGIRCYGGCLTSSAIKIVGASSECHDGGQIRAFLLLVGLLVLVVLLFTALYRGALEQLKRTAARLGALCSKKTPPPNARSDVSLRDASGVAEREWFEKLSLDRFNAVVTICVVKSVAVVGISLLLRDWWTYGGRDGRRSAEIVQSCSSVHENDCYSFCGDVSVVNVNITDDHVKVDDFNVPPQLHVTQSSSLDAYCVANLPGYCAYDFWLLFTLVPLMLHLLQLNLQLLTWWWFKEFTPQQRQYDAVIMHLYPQVYLSDPTGTESRAVLLGKRPGAGQDCDYRAMLRQLQTPAFYSVFAFIEMFTVLYVWGELQYPATYCGAVRPLSLYYYPILMTLLDLTKFNIYVAVQYAYRGLHVEAVLALFNAEMLLSNLWITTVLAAMFVVNGAVGVGAVVTRVRGGGGEQSAEEAERDADLESPVGTSGEGGGECVDMAGNPMHISNLPVAANHIDDDESAGRGVRLASAVTISGRTEWGKSRDTFG